MREKKSKNNASLHEIKHYQWKRKMIYFYLKDLPISLTAILVPTHSKSGGLNFTTSMRINKSSSSKDILGKPSINKSWQRRLRHRPIYTKYLFYWSKPNNCAIVIDARSHRTAEWVLYLSTYLSKPEVKARLWDVHRLASQGLWHLYICPLQNKRLWKMWLTSVYFHTHKSTRFRLKSIRWEYNLSLYLSGNS